jgi:PilZ domain
MAERDRRAERRRYPRLPMTLPVEGRWWDVEGRERPLHALLMLLSEGGATLRTSEPVAANMELEFEFRLGMLRNLQPRGKVRWWRRAGEIREVGVEFSEPARRIGVYVEKELSGED